MDGWLWGLRSRDVEGSWSLGASGFLVSVENL